MCTSIGRGSEVFGLLCHDTTFLREAKTRQRKRKENGIGETGGIVAKREPASGTPAPLKIPCKTIEENNFPADIVFSCQTRATHGETIRIIMLRESVVNIEESILLLNKYF